MSSAPKPPSNALAPAQLEPVGAKASTLNDLKLQRAFVAMQYTVGRREADLGRGLSTPLPAVAQLLTSLRQPSREERARALAREIKLITLALDSEELA